MYNWKNDLINFWINYCAAKRICQKDVRVSLNNFARVYRKENPDSRYINLSARIGIANASSFAPLWLLILIRPIWFPSARPRVLAYYRGILRMHNLAWRRNGFVPFSQTNNKVSFGFGDREWERERQRESLAVTYFHLGWPLFATFFAAYFAYVLRPFRDSSYIHHWQMRAECLFIAYTPNYSESPSCGLTLEDVPKTGLLPETHKRNTSLD